MVGGITPGTLTRPRQTPYSVGGSPFPVIPPDTEAQLFVQLYSKLSAALSVVGVVGDDSRSILSLQIPGLEILTHLDVHDPQTQYYIANALNPTLACSWTLVRGAATVTDVYKSILDGKETPIVDLSPEQRRELEQAQEYLFDPNGDPSEAYRQYDRYQLEYLEALDNYEAARATHDNGGEPIPEHLMKRLDSAEKAWNDDGHRLSVERAVATIGQYEALEPELFWKRLNERYWKYTRDAGVHSEFQYVTSNPPYERWFDAEGWSSFRFDSRDFENQRRGGGVGIGDGNACCCQCRATPVPPIPPARPARSIAPVDGEEFLLTAKLRRVEIIRPWMDVNVFYSRAWRWSRASVAYGVTVSTGGDIAGRLVPTGAMPVLPTTAILGTDIEIYWKEGSPMASAMREHLDSGDDVRFGPFSLASAKLGDEHHIKVPGTQLIGFISAILPQCPNPDPLLHWPPQQAKSRTWPV